MTWIPRRTFARTALMGLAGATVPVWLPGSLPFGRGGIWTPGRGFVGMGLDAFANLGSGAPALGAMARSLATSGVAYGEIPASDWSLVTIKVMNHVFTPLVFAPGQILNGQTNLVPQIVRATTRAGQAAAMLAAKGVDKLSDKPRYAALRLNKWFADMLHFGTIDGQAKSASNTFPAIAALVGEFPQQGAALQAFHHLRQTAGQNHALKGGKLRQDLGDLTLFAQEQGLIQSPLGISALMMGGEYDKAEGAVASNAVLAASDAEAIVVPSRRIAEFTAQLRQFVSRSHVSREPLPGNLAAAFDRIVVENPTLRGELIASIEAFKAALGSFDAASGLEAQRQIFDASLANGQSASTPAGASLEFLAQCLYTIQCLGLPGRPLRNFSLFLNVNDLDGKDLDALTNDVSPGQDLAAIHAYTYVEGMRQLAVGLNMFARRIAAGEKLVVAVVSEGGRGAAMEDAKTAFAFVMGPNGAGNLADALYVNRAEFNKTDSQILRDLAAEKAQIPWDTDEGLRTKEGAKLPGTVASTGDVQMGVVEFLESVTGISARTKLSQDDGRFARLARG